MAATAGAATRSVDSAERDRLVRVAKATSFYEEMETEPRLREYLAPRRLDMEWKELGSGSNAALVHST